MFVSFYLMHTQFFIQYIMYIFAGFAALTFFALSVVGILWCTKAVDTYYVKDKKTHVFTAYNTTCPNDETAAIVTASLAVVDCVAITVCGFVGMILFHLYSKSYGLKKKGESWKVRFHLIWFRILHYQVIALSILWHYHERCWQWNKLKYFIINIECIGFTWFATYHKEDSFISHVARPCREKCCTC